MDMEAPNERRETSWSAWYGEVLSVAALAPALVQRASQVFAPFAPAPEVADELSRAYAARTVDCARRALRAALRAITSSSNDSATVNACVLVASELMALESREQEDTLAGIDQHGVDADAVTWGDDGATLREGGGVMETHALLAALLEVPAVRPEVQELGFDVLDGVVRPPFQQDLRRAWAIVNGDPVPTPASDGEPTSDALTSVANELRALRAEVARRATPYEGTVDWIEDVVSALPPLLEQGEAAKALGVDPRTIRRMINRGELKSVDVGEGGRGRSCGVRIPRVAIADFLREKEARGQRPSSP